MSDRPKSLTDRNVHVWLDLAGGLLEPAVACERRMSDFIVPCVEPFVFVLAKQK